MKIQSFLINIRQREIKLKSVIFCGRLADYKYYNMDQVTARALMIFEKQFNKMKIG